VAEEGTTTSAPHGSRKDAVAIELRARRGRRACSYSSMWRSGPASGEGLQPVPADEWLMLFELAIAEVPTNLS